MHFWWAVVTTQSTQTSDGNHNGDKERYAQEVIEMIVNKPRISEWLDCEPVEPVEGERGNEDWVAKVAVTHC